MDTPGISLLQELPPSSPQASLSWAVSRGHRSPRNSARLVNSLARRIRIPIFLRQSNGIVRCGARMGITEARHRVAVEGARRVHVTGHRGTTIRVRGQCAIRQQGRLPVRSGLQVADPPGRAKGVPCHRVTIRRSACRTVRRPWDNPRNRVKQYVLTGVPVVQRTRARGAQGKGGRMVGG